MVDFSQLEAAVAAKESQSRAEVKESKKEISEIAAKVAEKVSDKESAGTRKSDASPEGKTPSATGKPSAKTYEFISADGTKVSVPADYKVIKKVDGKDVEATLADLADEFSGKTAWDKRFNEFSQQKKNFDSQFSYINGKVDKILAKAETDPMAAFYEICQLSGKTPEAVVKAMSKVGGESAKWLSLNETEQKAFMLEMENNLYKQTEAEKRAAQEREAKDREIESKAKAVKEQYGATDEEWAAASELAPKMWKGQDIGPEHIAQAHRVQTVATVFEKAYPEGLQDQKTFDEVFTIAMTHPEFDASDLEDIVTQTFASASAKRLGRKVTSQTPQKTESAKDTREAWSFDQV